MITETQLSLFNTPRHGKVHIYLPGEEVGFELDDKFLTGRIIGRDIDRGCHYVMFNWRKSLFLAPCAGAKDLYIENVASILALSEITDVMLYSITMQGAKDKASLAKSLQDRLDSLEVIRDMTLNHIPILRDALIKALPDLAEHG